MHCDMTSGRCRGTRGASRRTFSLSVRYAPTLLLAVFRAGCHVRLTCGPRRTDYARSATSVFVLVAAVRVGAPG